jgi:hypothetical protein
MSGPIPLAALRSPPATGRLPRAPPSLSGSIMFAPLARRLASRYSDEQASHSDQGDRAAAPAQSSISRAGLTTAAQNG